MDKVQMLTYYLKLDQYAKDNSGEIVLINDEKIIVFYPYKEGKKYSEYIANPDFEESLKDVTEYDNLAQL